MSVQANPLLAHSGHSAQKKSQDKQEIIDNNQSSSPEEVQHEAMPQMPSEEENSANQQNTAEEQPALTESKIVPAASPKTATVAPAASANIIPILGESLEYMFWRSSKISYG